MGILHRDLAMKEKINDYPIDKPLTAGRRQKIDRFIAANAQRLGRPVSHEWVESGKVLILASDPVEWRFIFHKNHLEVIGSAPFWVKLLFTEKRRRVANEVIEQMLDETGFRTGKPAAS